MGRKSNADFIDNAWLKSQTYEYYFNRLTNIAMSVFEWENLPETVDPRFMEMTLYRNGMCLFFKDEVVGELALPCTIAGTLDVYNVPIARRAYAANGYQAYRDNTNSVVIFHDYLHNVPMWDIQMFAMRLAKLQRTIDTNVYAQKTPVVILCDENKRTTYENIMMEYDADTPLIIGSKKLDMDAFKAINIEAPFVADQLEELRTMVWNDALTYLGISNVNVTKKERLITDEVQRNMGGTLASRFSPLDMRKRAAEKINQIFGLNVDVRFREDILAYQSQIIGETEEMIKEGDLDRE